MWEENAKEVEQVYGCYVDWEERFYICPDCEEPVYECDWSDSILKSFICPICEFRGGGIIMIIIRWNKSYIMEWLWFKFVPKNY